MADGPWADYAEGPWTDFADQKRYSSGAAGMQDAVGGYAVPTNSPQAAEARSPVGGNNFAQNLGLGYGRAFNQLGLGARQIMGLAPGSAATDQAALDAPLMATAGGQVGNLTGTIASAIPAGAAAAYGGIAAVPAAIGTGWLTGVLQPSTSQAGRIGNATLSAALAGGGQKFNDTLGSYLTRNVPAGFVAPKPEPALTPGQQNAADLAPGLGIRLTPGQQRGSVAMQQLEAKLASSPWTSEPFNELDAANRAATNRAWLGNSGGIGQGGASADTATLGQAADRIGSVFEQYRDPNMILQQDPAITRAAIDKVEQDSLGLLPNNSSIRDNPLVKQLESITDSGAISGEQLGNLSSKLGKAASNNMLSQGGDRELGQALYSIKDHVDDLVQAQLSPAQQAEFDAARQQYRSLMQLTARVGNVNPNTGNVGAGSLASYLQTKDKGGFLFGRNQTDAYNAVRVAQAFKPVVGNSGTATRSGSGIVDWSKGLLGNFISRNYLSTRPTGPLNALVGYPAGAILRGSVQAGSAVPGAIDSTAAAVAPYAQAGLPGLMGGSVPYLTQ